MIVRLVVAVFAVGLLVAADDPKKDDPAQADLKKLEGTWTVESATRDGTAEPNSKGAKIAFAGDKMTMTATDGKEEAMTVLLDPAKKPKAISFKLVKKVPNAAAGLGIYDLDGDKLKMCVGDPEKRPTEFTDKGQLLFVLKRKK